VCFFTPDSDDSKLIRQCVANAVIIFGSPADILPYIYDAVKLQWLQSTWAGVETLVDAVKRKKEHLYKQRYVCGDLTGVMLRISHWRFRVSLNCNICVVQMQLFYTRLA